MQREDAEVGEIARRIGYQLRRVDMLSMEHLHELMADVGVPPGRATALVYIHLHPGCDQAELGRVLGINRASTMAAVNGLVALGAVERRPGRDRRSNALHLTAQGQALRDEVTRIMAEHETSIFGSLSDAERTDLFRLLLKVRDSHTAIVPQAPSTRRAILRRIK
jgi:DNA-binding MarR family transcriptional regulator